MIYLQFSLSHWMVVSVMRNQARYKFGVTWARNAQPRHCEKAWQYKLQIVQLLTADKLRVRLERCRRLLRRVATLNLDRILFTDEKPPQPAGQQELVRRGSWAGAIVEHRLWSNRCSGVGTDCQLKSYSEAFDAVY